jgi:NPH3 family
VNASNVIPLFCASDNLRMEEEISDENLKAQTHKFLYNSVLKSWRDSIQALQSCNSCMKAATDLQILEHCVKSVAEKCFSTQQELIDPHHSWNGIQLMDRGPTTIAMDMVPTDASTHWWYADVATLPLPLFVEVISQLKFFGMDQEIITGSVNYYAKKCIPGLNRRDNITELGDELSAKEEQKIFVEEIVKILPFQKGTSSCKLLFGLLNNAKLHNASGATIYYLERCIGIQLDEANLEDLLILNFFISAKDKVVYDVDCVHRLLNHFLAKDKITNGGFQFKGINEDAQLLAVNPDGLTKVSYLIDAYLAEVASDSNLKLETFRSLAAAIPGYARLSCDLLYSAIDIYFKVI